MNPSETKKFRVSRIVEFGDTDTAGIVHFSNFFRYMESAECAFLRTLGLSVKLEWEGRQIGFPRVSATCDYLSPARFQDVLDVDVTPVRIGTKSVTYGFDISCQGRAVAKGQVASVCVLVTGADKFESIEIPATYRARIEPYAAGA